MSDEQEEYLRTFSLWLGSLGEDVELVAGAVRELAHPAGVRAPLAGALNYLLKSLDLIDDGIESIGYLDDAFVLRLALDRIVGGVPEALVGLRSDAGLAREFLGTLGSRFDRHVAGIESSSVRGRSVGAILEEAAVCEELVADVVGWAQRYEAPAFVALPSTLVKFRAFLDTRLPA